MFLITLAVTSAAMVAVAEPVEQTRAVTLPLTYVSMSTNITKIVLRGQERIAAINYNQRAGILSRQLHNGPATNEDVTYVAPVSIGGNTWQLVVDTASPIVSCGAYSKCEPTSTGKSSGGSVTCSGNSGTEYTDKVTYAGLTVQNQVVIALSSSSGFNGADGIMGFGPAAASSGCSPTAQSIPTFMDNLYRQGSIGSEVLGIYFKPESGSDTNDNNGELTLGATDPAKYTGSIAYFPKLTTGLAASYWGITVTGVSYGGTSLLAGNSSAIVDTSTTLLYIPASAYNAFLKASGGSTDASSGLSVWTTKPTGNFTIAFNTFGVTNYPLTPDQYLVPQAQYANFGLSSGKYYGWINNGGSSGVNFIIGQKFLEQYYSVYDTTNGRIGFAVRK